ncbi:hypothetical protein R4227_18645 [Gordonia amicalis]|uniref:hypothetical protein n=1 Tax=Gordonia amicalis TaxID=89053 RepID=UPI002954091B|nr:hypothetical protein [Gordonia amicalis]MDV7102081.1 hypothetical protein [Gordonia amicalis]
MNHERPPHGHDPEREEVPEYPHREIETRLITLVETQIATAIEREGPVDTDIARTIAACLYDHLPPDAQEATLRFIILGLPASQEMWSPALERIHLSDMPEALQRWACWLATYSLGATPPPGGDPLPTDGDALHAFLQTAEPSGPIDIERALDEWADRYCDSYQTLDEVLEGVTHLAEAERKISNIAEAYNLSDFVTIDRDALLEEITRDHTILEAGGRLHVFVRSESED